MRRITYAVIIGIVVIGIVLGIGSIYMLSVSLKPQSSSRNIPESYEYLFKHAYLKHWVDSLNQSSALKDTFITSDFDGTRLHALYIKAAVPTKRTALIIHGYTDNAVRMLMIGHLYNRELGYNVLLPDLHAHGESGGEWVQMGWFDRFDVMQWIGITKGIYGDSISMTLHGISMGAATTMMTSGEKLPDNVKCFVEDCGYTSVWDEFSYKLKSDYGLPAFPLLYTTSAYCHMKLGWNFKEASALNQVSKCTRPMFFIHGDDDTYVPPWMVLPLFEQKQGMDKEIWILPGVKHADAYWDHTEEYVQRVGKFVGKYIE